MDIVSSYLYANPTGLAWKDAITLRYFSKELCKPMVLVAKCTGAQRRRLIDLLHPCATSVVFKPTRCLGRHIVVSQAALGDSMLLSLPRTLRHLELGGMYFAGGFSIFGIMRRVLPSALVVLPLYTLCENPVEDKEVDALLDNIVITHLRINVESQIGTDMAVRMLSSAARIDNIMVSAVHDRTTIAGFTKLRQAS